MKRSPFRRRALAPLGVVLAVAAAASGGCSAVLGFPDRGDESGVETCHNGADDDLDGRIDCRDPGCAAACVESDALACSNGVDDDDDGTIDCADEACRVFCREGAGATCSDGLDNDVDGLTDCRDTDCRASCPEGTAATCSNQADDDTDGLADCDDADCDGFCPEEDAATCADARDNDGDGLTDVADPRCWPLTAPSVARCGARPAVQFAPRFENSLAWVPFPGGGVALPGGNFPTKLQSPLDRTGRTDSALGFTIDTTAPPVADFWRSANYGVTSVAVLEGPWDGFELAFSVRIVEFARASVALHAAGSVESGITPSSDVEAVVVGVELSAAEGDGSTGLAKLIVGGRVTTATFPLPAEGAVCNSSLGATYCRGGWARVRVVTEGQDAAAYLEGVTGPLELRNRRPSGSRVAGSRVVVRGEAAGLRFSPGASSYGALYDPWVDDLSLRFAAEQACGIEAPQIPFGDGAYCDSHRAALTEDTGHSVSLAAGGGAFCAVVASGPLQGRATALRSWRSTSGEQFARDAVPSSPEDGGAGDGGDADADAEAGAADGGTSPGDAGSGGGVIPAPPGAAVIGGAVAWDPSSSGWVAAVVWEVGGVRHLALSESSDCSAWGALGPEVVLAPDAEAPSLVIDDGGQRTLWYTRAPNDATGRTLWQATVSQGVATLAPEPTYEFDSALAVTAPVSITRVGAKDVVATYRVGASAGVPGLGVLVARDAGLRQWEPLTDPPLLEASVASRSFDDGDLVSGSIVWRDARGGILLYGARGSRFSGGLVSGGGQEPMTVGTARLQVPVRIPIGGGPGLDAGAGDAGPDAGAPAVVRCGDGTCAASESCLACEIDCACPGTTLFQERMEDPTAWSAQVGLGPTANGALFVDRQAECVRAEPVGSGRLIRALPTAVTGDFELEATLVLDSAGDGPTLGVLAIGLDTAAIVAAPIVTRGVYAVLGGCGVFGARPCALGEVPLAPSTSGAVVDNTAPRAALLVNGTERVRVRLRRAQGRISVQAVDAAQCDRPVVPLEREYFGGIGPLTHLVVDVSGMGVLAEIDDVVVRALADPAACPASQVLCGGACVDTDTSNEHCGGCDLGCPADRSCGGGVCRCPGAECEGACVDLAVDPGNCGGCGVACGAAAYCTAGACVAAASGTCSEPAPLALNVPIPFTLQPEPSCGESGSYVVAGQVPPDLVGSLLRVSVTTPGATGVKAFTLSAFPCEQVPCNEYLGPFELQIGQSFTMTLAGPVGTQGTIEFRVP